MDQAVTTVAPVDVDALPPTQYLMLEVLAARYRLGETLWTFPAGSAYRTAAEQLAKAGLVGWKGGVAPKTIQVWLTDTGRSAALSDTYKPPNEQSPDCLACLNQPRPGHYCADCGRQA